jgi:DNA repair protein RadC
VCWKGFWIEIADRVAQTGGVTENLRIKDMPPSERPRERLAAYGADHLSSADLLAILVRTGTRGASALQVAGLLLKEFPSLNELASAPIERIQDIRGVGRDKAITLKAAFTLAVRMAREMRQESPLLDSPDQVADWMREECRNAEVERFHVLLLNVRRRLIRHERLSDGTLDTILVHPRQVFRAAIAANAGAVVIVHNHPSGDPSPSDADIKVTRDLIRAGHVLKIEVLDHIIIGRSTQERPKDYVSLRELGYFST